MTDSMENILKRTSPKSSGLNDILSGWELNGFKKIRDQYSQLKRVRELRPASHIIQDTSEKAYQRAFYLNGISDLKLKNGQHETIEWLDLEVPVAYSRNARRPSLDLVGRINDCIAIAELKDKGGNSPFHAIFEVFQYFLAAEDLKSRPPYHEHPRNGKKDYWNEIGACKFLLIAGPKSYWKPWADHLEKIRQIAALISHDFSLRVTLASFVDEDFRAQKNHKDRYSPRLIENKDNIWEEI